MSVSCPTLGEMLLRLAVALLALATWARGQDFDPVYDRCARWHHSAMLRRSSIFIDGGVELYQDNRTRWLGFNKYIYEFDMSQSWNASTNFTESRIGRYADNSTDSNPPNMLRGGLYAAMSESNRLFTFGGSTFLANDSDPDWAPPSKDPTTLWSFDTELRNWQSYDISASIPWRPNWGPVTEDVAHSVGFFLNGQYDRGSSYGLYTSVQYRGGTVTNDTFNQISYLGGMVMIDLHTQETRNLSTTTLGNPRVAGGLLHAPGFGKSKNGTLVAFGGMMSSGQGSDTFTNGQLINFTTVGLCDSFRDENVTWVNQTTTGDIPPPRMDFCVCPGQKSPQDNSSFNFYIHGGIDPGSGTVYDDVYVLSFPSFTWTLVNPGSSTAPGYFGHTCNSAGKRQMLATGGARDASLLGIETTGDVPNLNATTCDDSAAGVRLFDMVSATWSTFYNASQAALFRVPDAVVKRIGGTPDGNATMTAPANGFDDPAVYTMFHPPPPANTSASSPSSTPSSSSSSISGGAIAGAVVGSVAGAALIFGLVIWLCCRRRRRQKRQHGSDDARAAAFMADEKARRPSELPGQPAEIHEKPADAPGLAGEKEDDGARKGAARPPPAGEDLGPQELDAVGPEMHELGGNGYGASAVKEGPRGTPPDGSDADSARRQPRETAQVGRKSAFAEDTR
ncbi:Galactose oxidase/kelch beta-propeller [Lasiodiplodia theobromae]|nr:Galactose oxidase/kelch beta-propeller [Lasiodiplodia theobromae]